MPSLSLESDLKATMKQVNLKSSRKAGIDDLLPVLQGSMLGLFLIGNSRPSKF